jgi:molybdopterin synthase catalytic subunit
VAEQTRTGVVRLVDIRDRELSADEVLRAVADDAAGASAVFVGTVRNDDDGQPVVSLAYEAHDDAVALMAEVVEEVASRHQVIAVAAIHRIGLLEVGDVAVIAAASAGHRAEAFEACRDVIDEVKARVPIWKRQTFADGHVEWPGIEPTGIEEASAR